MAKRGQQPLPIERRRRLGNPGKRPLPEPTEIITPAVTADGAPAPMFPLGTRGRAIWDAVLTTGATWIAPTDLPVLQRLCELEDDAANLRYQILESQRSKTSRYPWRAQAHLLAMSKEIRQLYGDLGLTPSERSRLGAAEVHAAADITRATATASRTKTWTDTIPAPSANGEIGSAPRVGPPYKSWTRAKILAFYTAEGITVPDPDATKHELLALAATA